MTSNLEDADSLAPRRTVLLGMGGALLASLTAACARQPTRASATAASAQPAKGHPMIVEYIRYEIAEDRREAFVAAYRDAGAELRASKHCLRYELSQCTEEPSSFVVRIEWDSLDGHMKGFRTGKEFPPFFAKVKPFFEQIREMRHYAVGDVVFARA